MPHTLRKAPMNSAVLVTGIHDCLRMTCLQYTLSPVFQTLPTMIHMDLLCIRTTLATKWPLIGKLMRPILIQVLMPRTPSSQAVPTMVHPDLLCMRNTLAHKWLILHIQARLMENPFQTLPSTCLPVSFKTPT